MKDRADATAAAAPAARRPLRTQHLVWIVLSLAIVLDLGLGWWLYEYRLAPPRPEPPGVQTFSPEPAPDFHLTDQNGNAFSPADLQGHWSVLLFGFTHCPDCPATLAALDSLLHRLENEAPGMAADTRVVFVSVDPFRDTPPLLNEFVTRFNPHFIAATGTPEQLQQLTAALGASYDYADPVSGERLSDGSRRPLQAYTVDRAAGLYVFDPRARNVAWILPPHTPERLDAAYHFIRKRYGQ